MSILDTARVSGTPAPAGAAPPASGASGAPRPLKVQPLIVSTNDIFDYAKVLQPLVVSFNDDDYLPHVIYKDPDFEQAEVERLIGLAAALDGCEQGLTCPGWRPEEPEPTGGFDIAANLKALQARKYRQEAFQHRVDARFMEDRIAARGKPVSKAQIAEEVRLGKDWTRWLDYYKAYLASTAKATLVGPSDFAEMQRFDLQLQGFRDRYTKLLGLMPTAALPAVPPTPTNPFSEAGKGLQSTVSSLTTLIAVAVGAYILVNLVGNKGTTTVVTATPTNAPPSLPRGRVTPRVIDATFEPVLPKGTAQPKFGGLGQRRVFAHR